VGLSRKALAILNCLVERLARLFGREGEWLPLQTWHEKPRADFMEQTLTAIEGMARKKSRTRHPNPNLGPDRRTFTHKQERCDYANCC